jgi:predicted esterase
MGKLESLPHAKTETLRLGAHPEVADHAAIILHGRGGTPSSIEKQLRDAFPHFLTQKLCILAPAAQGNSWYPKRVSDPYAANARHVEGAMARIEEEIVQLEGEGIPRNRIMIAGFSQGGCLAARFVLTYPAEYWGVFILSGAVPGLVKEGEETGVEGIDDITTIDLHFTRVFVGCGDSDALCPSEWADSTAEILEKTGANVDKRIYSGMGHVVCNDERDAIRALIAQAKTGS